MKLTIKQLEDISACDSQVRKFRETFGSYAEVTESNLEYAVEGSLDVEGFFFSMIGFSEVPALSTPQWQEYTAMRDAMHRELRTASEPIVEDKDALADRTRELRQELRFVASAVTNHGVVIPRGPVDQEPMSPGEVWGLKEKLEELHAMAHKALNAVENRVRTMIYGKWNPIIDQARKVWRTQVLWPMVIEFIGDREMSDFMVP